MPAITEEKEDYILHKASGLYTYQDMEALIRYVNPVIEKDPNAKFLLDYSEMTNYEPKAMKMAYDRIAEGFPKTVKIALFHKKKGFFNFILNEISHSMIQNSKFFSDFEDAKNWLLEKSV